VDAATLAMLGHSRAMVDVFDQVRLLADCDAPVLIVGERGTGKELAARAIHQHSPRAAGPYVTVECAGGPARLTEASLFGAAARAPDGQSRRIPGRLEHAHRGTLFLDEIGDMPIELQGLLVRFLRHGEVMPVGGRRLLRLDVRVVAATKTKLCEAVVAGRLRRDLYEQLHAPKLRLPPLRERYGDVEVLATHFLRRIGRELERNFRGFTREALTVLAAHPWPGNVRELIAAIEGAALSAHGPLIDAQDLRLSRPPVDPRPTRRRASRSASRPKPGSEAEREAILHALDASRLNMTRAAQLLGVARATLYRMLRRHRIELPPPPASATPPDRGAR
jgi:DNA-binding NtrC family response regulator